MTWWIPKKDWLQPPRLDDDLDYQAADAWAREFTPEPGKEAYGIALEHAKRKYDEAVGHFDMLDKKADELMRTAVTIAALLVAAIRALDVEVSIWLVLALVFFLLTTIVAAITRRPTLQATPGSVHEVLGFVDDFRIRDRHQIEALVAASLRCAIVGTQLAIRWKSVQISRATVMFVIGVVLVLPVFL